jgi:hypothetical protein
MMRVLLIAALAALTVPALADGLGGSNQQSTTTTQTTTSKTQDGDTTTTTTTTHSETTSSGGGFNLGGIFGNGGGHSPAAPSYESLGGSWTIGETNSSKTCTLTLEKTKFISNYGARTGIGCPEGLFSVSSWLLAGDEIRLQSPAGSLLAKLHPAGHGRWNGATTAGLDIFMTKN